MGVAPCDCSGSSNPQQDSIDCEAQYDVERIVDYQYEDVVASSQQTYLDQR